MMLLILACVYFALLAVALQVLTVSVCARHGALWPWRRFLQVVALVWLAMAVAKKGYIDEIFPPHDGLVHEAVARDVADLLIAGEFTDAFSGLMPGNATYQFILGVFYALTSAPDVVTYAVNGALGYWGLLVLMEVLCRQTNCVRLPASVVFVLTLLPSALLWTTKNLKEGPILWGICMMCYLTVPAERYRGRPPRVLPLLGLLMVATMRPHIAIAWLIAIGIGTLLTTRRFGLFVTSVTGTVASVVLLSVLKPAIFEQAVGDGITTALSNRYDELSNNESAGGAAITGSNPVPVLSGLALILFRPWPTETQGVDSFLAGLEVWGLAAFGLLNWKMARGKVRLGTHPGLITHVIVLLLMGFFFSYMYNMGLAVRQRLMCYPAVLTIYTWPLLASQQATNALLVRRKTYHRTPLRASAKVSGIQKKGDTRSAEVMCSTVDNSLPQPHPARQRNSRMVRPNASYTNTLRQT